MQKTSKQLVTYWPSGNVNNVFIEAIIMGSDAQLHFPRICDTARGRHAFKANFITSLDDEVSKN